MALQPLQARFTYLLSLLIQYAYARGYELTMGDVWAKSGHRNGSYHYIRLAADFNLFKDGMWLKHTADHRFLGRFWESLDPRCTWGGRFSSPDGNHYSYMEWGRKGK